MTDKENPVFLEMPEGLTEEAMETIREQAAKVHAATGVVLVCLPHGTKRATQQVEHHMDAEMDDALMALPRIATALENIAEHLSVIARTHQR